MEKFIAWLPASWRTTIIGSMMGLPVLGQQIKNLLDDDPATLFDWKLALIGAGMAVFGWFTRDDKVTSEAAKAKP